MTAKPRSTDRTSPAAELPTPSAAEQRAINGATLRVSERAPRFALRMRQNGDNQIDVLGAEHGDHDGWLTRLEDAFGSRGQSFPISQLNKLMTSCREKDGKFDVVKLNGMLAMIEGAKPRNEIEAALAIQMAQTHAAAQQLLARALSVDQIAQFDSANNAANKLLRTFALQAETLAKLQRGGEQIVKVVHVHPGAQAIIGDVRTGASGASGDRTGEGAAFENSNQPHAKGMLPANGPCPMSEVRGADAGGEPVPLASGCR